MEVLETLFKLLENDPVNALLAVSIAVLFWNARNADRDDKNVSGLITLTSSVVTVFEATFKPMQKLLENTVSHQESIVKLMNETQTLLHSTQRENQLAHQKQMDVLDSVQSESRATSKRRDDQHDELIRRMNANQSKIEEIARQITRDTEEGTLRADMVRVIMAATEMSTDIKRLLDVENSKPKKLTIENDKESKERTV